MSTANAIQDVQITHTPAVSKPAFSSGPAVLACIIYFVAPATYFGTEYYVSQVYSPSYSYKEHFTSQLGVPLEYVERDTGRTAFSPRAHLMNIMFVANGIFFLVGQRLLLGSHERPKMATTRMFLAIGYLIGIAVVAAVPAGNKEEEAGLAPLHGIAALLAMVLGNVNSLLTGIAATQWGSHKVMSLVCGIVGLVSVVLFFLGGGTGPTPGLYQRLSIYTTQIWMLFTADMLMGEISKIIKELDRQEEERMKQE